MMIDHPDEEIKAKATELWSDVDNIEVSRYRGEVRISISSMYDSPGLRFEQLKSLAEYFDTLNVDDKAGSIREGGCETCDYGSKYGFVLRIW